MTGRLLELDRALVTGATGFLGRHLTRALLERPRLRTRVLVRSEERLGQVFGDDRERLEVVTGDLDDGTSLDEACRGADVVFHCAALGTSAFGRRNRPGDYERVNECGTAALAAAARRAGVRRFVHVSSTGVMGACPEPAVDETTPCRPRSLYQRSKLAAELRLLEMSRDGLPAVILRPCLIAGEGKRGGDLLRLFKLCRRGLFPVFASSLDTAKPLVAVDDVVQALLLASVRGRAGEVYLVHSGARHTLGQILEVAGRLVGNPRPYRRLPLLPAFAAAQLVASLARAVGRTPPLSPERLELYLTDRSIVIDKARRELGYRPRHQDLDDMLGRAFRDFARTGQL